MKLKKCFKTVLSAVLAAAMIVTAAPATNVLAAQDVPVTTEAEETVAVPETEQTAAVGDDNTAPVEDGTQQPELVKPVNDAAVSSPVVTDKSVTFNYEDTEGNAQKVQVKGTMTKPTWELIDMTKGENNVWSTTIASLSAGKYEYGFVVDDNWKADPQNLPTSGNSSFVIAGLADYEGISVARGNTAELPTELDFYSADGSSQKKTVSYALSSETQTSYSDKITLGTSETNIPTVTVSSDWDTSVETFTLTAKAAGDENLTSTVTVNVLAKSYTEDPTVQSPVAGKGQATFYYFGPTAKKVIVKGGWDSWAVKVLMVFDTETGYWSATVKMNPGTYGYGFDVDDNWTPDPLNTDSTLEDGNKRVVVTEASDEEHPVSPQIEGNKVTFIYQSDTAEKVSIAGTLPGISWDPNKVMLVKNETSGYWEYTIENLPAGKYEYKYIVGDNGWITDPWNQNKENDNSILYIAGLEAPAVEVTRDGKSTELPKTLKLYTVDATTLSGTSADTAVTYDLSDDTKAKDYANAIVLTPNEETGITTISITDAFPTDITSFTLTAKDAADNVSTVTVSVVDAKYTYTIYYYDPDHATTDSAELWIWENKGSGGNKAFPFQTSEVLDDGKTWLKATVELSFTNLGMKARQPGTWEDWSEGFDRLYNNETKAEQQTLYLVADDKTIYTQLPEIKAAEKRYLVVEYARNSGSAENWYFYTWNSGYGGNVFVPFEKAGDKWIAKVPVKQGLESISYCIERADVADGTVTHWAEKDGNDYLCAMPADQNVVKIQMEEGKGITYVYPYNTGYELAPEEGKIHFYYRDDEVFAAGNEGGYASVQIEINKTAYDMTYNAAEQRYTYDVENLVPGTYKYRYILKKTADSTPEYVLDKYNEEKVTENETEYSVCKYEKFDAAATAAFGNASMDYNDNNVLSVKFTGADGKEVKGIEVANATADLSALGGGITEIEPELLALSIAVKEGTPAGEYTVPVTVFDQYNNEYKTTAKVTVTDRNKGTDFDWDEAVIYFTVTDRFFDGNSSNNGAEYNKGENGSLSYHGGDFAGLTQKLDYLDDLGVNTIWITPIVENKMAEGLTTDIDGKLTDILSWGYHGYWASNFEKLDSHLGTEEEFKTLLDAAHARGMKIMVDVVLNHSGYEQEEYFNNILKDENGNSIPMIRTDDQMVTGSDQQTSLSGLPDFVTENPEVRAMLVAWQSNWVSKYDIDYYRVDTVKHVDDATWSAFKNALTEIDPDFKMIGEWAGAGYATDAGMLRAGRMDSLLDFDFNDKALDFVTGKISDTESFLRARNGAIDNTATLGAFIGSHDEDGFKVKLEKEKKVDKSKLDALAKVAASLQLTSKGQVVIYYGEEIGMTGANDYPYQTNRYDFDWSQTTEEAKNTTLAHYKKLLAIREMYSEVLAKGARNTLLADDANGLDVFERSLSGVSVYTALNISDAAKEYTFTGLTPNSSLMDLYSRKAYQVDSTGKVTVTVPAAADGGTAILAQGGFYTETAQEGFWVDSVVDQTYTGKNITLSEDQLKVYYGLTRLKAGTDYTVKYKNNKAVGTATVTITGKGNYSDKVTVDFNILAKDLAEDDVTVQYQADLIATGKSQKPLEKVTYNGIKLGRKDYKVEYYKLDESGKYISETEALSGVKEAGRYEMVITGLYDPSKEISSTNKGNFTGEVKKVIEVHETGTYMKKTTVTVSGSSAEYTGVEIRPEVKVTLKDKAKTTVSADSYEVTYKNNVEVGTATVIVTGIPAKGYYGSVTKTFKITGKKLAAEAEVDSAGWKSEVVYDVHTGSAVQDVNQDGTSQVKLVLKQKDENGNTVSLTENKDYKVSYLNNKKPGTATMVFTGIGKYTGVVKKTFKVTKITLTAEDSKLQYTVASQAAYAKKGAKAAVTVSYDGVALKEGRDYKLTYRNNKAVTAADATDDKKPQVTINGMGAFTGKLVNTDSKDAVTDTTFMVVKADLSALKITANDVVYSNKKGKFMSTPVITDASGSKLANRKDFTLEYFEVNADGTETARTADDIVGLTETTGADGEKISSPTTIKVVATAAANSNYTEGSKAVAAYRVVAANIAKAKVTINAQVYTGKAITIGKDDIAKFKVGKDDLTLGDDYEIVSYDNNVKKGTASVMVKGIGNYGGTKKVTFKITSRPMAWWWNLIH